MDGIPVKINEKYKPPPKITLPACILNRLNNVQFTGYAYDFSLETTVAEHMARLNKISRDDIERFEAAHTGGQAAKSQEDKPFAEEPTILTPVPISSSSTVTTSTKQMFKYSDFENDTSSPFDNEELKTLNDMEELAHVLGATSVSGRTQVDVEWPQYGPQTYYNVYNNPLSTSQPYSSQMPSYQMYQEYKEVQSQPELYANKPKPDEKVNGENEEDGRVSDIVKSLEEYLGQRKMVDTPHPVSPPSFLKLTESQQKMARQIGDMGFPLSRAVCAVKLFGSDESKIIEYLLLVQSFVDKGYTESQTILALELNQCDELQTENYLKVLSQIMKLGFKEEEVVTALAKTKNDRDKALDILIR